LNIFSIISIICAAAALIMGLRAAYYWWEASRIEPDPGWKTTADDPRPIEPVDEQLKQMGWTIATLKAARESAALNKKAAIWTACAVVLGTISSVVGALTGCF
jgi:hypothetical protein